MKFALINLRHPYGKSQVYFNASLASVAAMLLVMGHSVEYLDFNLDNPDDPRLMNADVIGISLIGAPYIPGALALAEHLKDSGKPILMGGQVIENLSEGQFAKIFAGTNARQIRNNSDLANFLECNPTKIPNPYRLSLRAIWETLTPERRRTYISNEMPLVVGQGCAFQCAFCAAHKREREVHVSTDSFEYGLRYLANEAKQAGVRQLNFYASSLDFFQNPEKIAEYLEVLAQVQEETGIRIQVRCLSCMQSFLRASEKITNFGPLLKRAGLWCIGFGADGTDLSVWKAQKKFQNKPNEVRECLDLCEQLGVHAEILLVIGFPEDTVRTLAKTLWSGLRFTTKWRGTTLRPYLAKPAVPGNDNWKTAEEVEEFVNNPELFYNLDFASIGSTLTHPHRWHRYASNIAYLTLIGVFTPFGRCDTSPLLPQGNSGLYGRLARLVNRMMPFDR